MNLIGLQKFIRELFEKNSIWAYVNEAGTNNLVPEASISEK